MGVLLLAEATASMCNRRERTCYPSRTQAQKSRLFFVQQRMCLQHICCHNQVFSQGYLVRSEEYKAIMFGSELLPDCVCNSTEVITHYIREPGDSFSPSLYQALKKLEIVFT